MNWTYARIDIRAGIDEQGRTGATGRTDLTSAAEGAGKRRRNHRSTLMRQVKGRGGGRNRRLTPRPAQQPTREGGRKPSDRYLPCWWQITREGEASNLIDIHSAGRRQEETAPLIPKASHKQQGHAGRQEETNGSINGAQRQVPSQSWCRKKPSDGLLQCQRRQLR
jgi:hypothetical protein